MSKTLRYVSIGWLLAAMAIPYASAEIPETDWWSPGEGRVFQAEQLYPNQHGLLGVQLENGPFDILKNLI